MAILRKLGYSLVEQFGLVLVREGKLKEIVAKRLVCSISGR
jgi:hypothetical protein